MLDNLIGAFTAAWLRPDKFRRLLGYLSSFALMAGGNPCPELIPHVPRKPLRGFFRQVTETYTGTSRAKLAGVYIQMRCYDAWGGTSMSDQRLPGYRLNRLHHTQLAIPPESEPTAREFYGDVLGMAEIDKPPVLAARGGCWFRSGGLEIHLGVEQDFRPARKAHPGILVDDIGALAKHLGERGIEVSWDDNFPGHHRFYAHDPFGNRLEFLEPQQPA